MAIIVNLGVVLTQKEMSAAKLSEKVGIMTANIFILKTGKAKAIHSSTFEKICKVLGCQLGDLLSYQKDPDPIPKKGI